MSGKAGQKTELSKKDTMYVERFVYDVLKYTLQKCGLPLRKIPRIRCKGNWYYRYHFVIVAGVSALRISLLMREKWRQTFISERNSFETKTEEVSIILAKLARNCSLSRERTVQSTVEVLLAACNEILLFFHHEGIDIDVIKVMKSVSTYILLIIEPGQSVPEKIEGLFEEIGRISRYIKSIKNFIKDCATPYGSKEDVSNLFLKRIKIKFGLLKKSSPPGTPAIDIVKYHLGYLPLDFFLAVTGEELPDNLVSASGSILPDDDKSPESAKLPCTSESGVKGTRKSGGERSKRPEDVSIKSTKGEQSSKNSPELGIEDDLGQISLIDEGASQTSDGPIPQQKSPEKESGPSTLPNDCQSQEPAKLPCTSESGVKGRRKSGGEQSKRPEDVSKQTNKGEQSSKNSSELGIEADLGQISLIDEGASQTSDGPIPQQKSPEKESGPSTLPNDCQSQEPAKLPCTSESGVKGRRNSVGEQSKRPEDVSKQTNKGEQTNKNSSELGIEADLGQISLMDEGVSETSNGAMPKRNTPTEESP